MGLDTGNIISLSGKKYILQKCRKRPLPNDLSKKSLGFEACQVIDKDKHNNNNLLFIKIARTPNIDCPNIAQILLEQEKNVYQTLGNDDPLTPQFYNDGFFSFDHKDYYAIVREFRTGQHLAELPSIERRLFMDLIRAAIKTLVKYEGAGFYHGDLCPEHLLIGPDNKFTLIDPIGYPFTTPWNVVNNVRGTGHYNFLHPRDRKNRKVVSDYRDTYAIGKILEWAFENTPWSDLSLRAINELIDKALRVDLRFVYLSMSELLEDFEAVYREFPFKGEPIR